MTEIDAETPAIEAYRITISYSFDVDGIEYISIEPREPVSSVLLLGILDFARHRVLHPDDDDEEEED